MAGLVLFTLAALFFRVGLAISDQLAAELGYPAGVDVW
jgi:hypothetical protein